ncbi:MucR family transcriptional regulator [Methylobacterium oxalidis]|uniref:MucR family transcriptional regulator n=1 Tax=Methylobacterium oxalidis TaxID=944322 RepID=UPI00331499D0
MPTKGPPPAALVSLTAEIVSAYLGRNHVRPNDLTGLIESVHASLAGLSVHSGSATPAVAKPTPAEIKRSVTPDHLVSFEDGKPYKTLARHLRLRGLSPQAYRARWGLPLDYPMTAASYSAQRAELARSSGLGRGGGPRPAPAGAGEGAAPGGASEPADAEAVAHTLTREPFEDDGVAE